MVLVLACNLPCRVISTTGNPEHLKEVCCNPILLLNSSVKLLMLPVILKSSFFRNHLQCKLEVRGFLVLSYLWAGSRAVIPAGAFGFSNTTSVDLSVADSRAFKKYCVSEDGAKTAQRHAAAWIRKGGPFLQNHTFVSWARTYGTSHLSIFWRSLVFNKWSKDMESLIVKHFRCALPSF